MFRIIISLFIGVVIVGKFCMLIVVELTTNVPFLAINIYLCAFP